VLVTWSQRMRAVADCPTRVGGRGLEEVERLAEQGVAERCFDTAEVVNAWDFVFRVVLRPSQRVSREAVHPAGARAAEPHGTPAARGVHWEVERKAEPPATGPQDPWLELPDEDRGATKQAVEAINVATAVANAVVADAAERCRREHQQLAQELGLARPPVGFQRD
jgi:hypothetical protein